jgi:hypothetical protein
MAENIATTANESVARGVEGSGQAQIIGMKGVDPLAHYQRGRNLNAPDPEVVAKNKKAQNDAAQKLLDTDFDMGWQIHDNEIQAKVDNYRNDVVAYGKGGGDYTDVDFQRVMQGEQDEINLHVRRSESMKEAYGEVYELTSGKTADSRYDREKSFNELQNQTKEFDKDGNIVGARNAFDMDDEQMRSIAENPDNFNMAEVWKVGLESFDEMTDKAYKKVHGTYGTTKDIEKWSGTLLKRDANGNLVKKNGVAVIDIDASDPNDPAKQVLYQDDFIKRYVDQQRALYADENGMISRQDEAKIWAEPIKMMESNLSVERSQTEKDYSEARLKRTLKPNVDVTQGKKVLRKVGLEKPDGSTSYVNQYIPDEYVLSSEKIDRTIPVKSLKYYNIETGKVEESKPGDSDMIVTAVQYVPWTKKTKTKGGEDIIGAGDMMRVGSDTELFDQQLKDSDHGGKWMVQGTYTNMDGEEVQAWIPYADVSEMIKRKTGFDLNNRDFKDYSDEELVDHFRRISTTKLTPEQLLAAIQKVRDLGQEEE